MNSMWAIQATGNIAVSKIETEWANEDHHEPGDPKVFEALRMVAFEAEWDRPQFWSSLESAQQALETIPESIRKVLRVVEWTGRWK
jgi:hypothetical protein